MPPKEVVSLMLERIEADEFHILCPDDETSLEQDYKRIALAAGDVTEKRRRY